MPFVFTSNTQLQTSVAAWIINGTNGSTDAINAYNNEHISLWNVSAITDMSNLFMNRTAFDDNISGWNVSNVTNMSNMFNSARVFNALIGVWNVSNVRNMQGMFAGSQYTNIPLNAWNVRNVTNMSNMFSGCTRYDQNIRAWPVGSSTVLANMFSGATAMINNQLAPVTPVYNTWFNQNVLPTGSVTITGTATENKVLTASHTLADVNGPALLTVSYQWKRSLTSTVAGSNILLNATSSTYVLVSDDVGKYITVTASYQDSLANNESVTSASTTAVAVFVPIPTDTRAQLDVAVTSWISNPTFSNPYGPINKWNVSAITDMSNLFISKASFNSDISGWNVSQVTNMSGMFNGAFAFNQPLNAWNVSNVTNMDGMFTQAQYFDQPLNSWNILKVTNMHNMFFDNFRFNQNISNWNVRNVTDMRGMFANAAAFNWNIRGWYVGQATLLNDMFYGATLMLANQTAIATPPYTYFTQLPVNVLPTGSVTITGTATQNQILTASHSLADANGPALLTVSYKWKRGLTSAAAGSEILNATGSTYTLVSDDIGKYITVTASYIDGIGNPESVTSVATAVIALFVPLPTGTRAQLDAAITSWISNPTLSNPYGPINTWNVSAVTNMSNLFNGKSTFNSDISDWNVSNVINMEGMFTGAVAFNQPLNSWNVSKVTTMAFMFYNTVAAAFNQPLNSWIVSKVTSTTNMFRNTQFNQPLNSWNVSQVTNLSSMFRNTPFNQPLNSWNVSNVLFAIDMFRDAVAFNQNIRGWDLGPVVDLTLMFSGATAMLANQTAIATPLYSYFTPVNKPTTGSVTIAGTPTQNQVLMVTTSGISNGNNGMGAFSYKWKRGLTSTVAGSEILNATSSTYALVPDDVGKYITVTVSYQDLLGNNESVTSASTAAVAAFAPLPTGTRAQLNAAVTSWISNPTLSNPYGPINTWNVSAITDMSYLFQYKPTFNSDISDWIVSNVTNMQGMFQGATAFNQPLNSWDMSKVVIMSKMFNYASSFNQPLNSWIVSNAVHMGEMFSRATSFDQSIGAWNVSKVVDMNNMFLGATAFNQPLDSWIVIQLANTSNMFCAATKFNQPLGSWIVSNVTEMGAMFSGATAFNQPLNAWNVSKVKNMTSMFQNNAIFNQPLSSWIVSQVTTMQNMFNGAAAFNQPLNSWNLSKVTNLSGMFAGATLFDQPLDSWNVSNVNTMSNMFLNAPVFNRNIRGWYVGQSTLLSGMFSGATAMLANQEASATPPHAYFNQAIQYIPPNGGVLITGTAEQGTSLTASNTFDDPDGVGTVYYQWIRDGSAILEAINSTWTLTAADVGKLITVTATYVDGLGKTKRSASQATDAVGNVNDPVVGYVMIDGDLTQGQTLTASHTLTDDDGFSTAVSYKWLKNGSIISGALNPTYQLTPDDIGAKISVMASYTDNGGKDESKTSVETFKIQPLRAAYSLITKGIETMPLRTQVNGNIIIADASELVVTSSNNTGAISTMTSVENQAWIKHNASALLSKYTPSLGSDKLYISKSLLPFAVTSTVIDAVELIDAKSSSVASPLVRVGDASIGAFYIDTQPGNSVTLTYSPDTVVITHISESAFTVAINGGAAVNKLVGDKILLKNVVLTLGSITGEPNNPPVFVQNAPTSVYAGASYSYTVSVSDADNDTFTVTAPILPSWLTFNQATGTLSSSSVPSSVVGSHAVQILAQDIWGGQTYYDFIITVQNVPATGTGDDAIKFVLPTLNASLALFEALRITGNYNPPAAFDVLPTITLSMPAASFNGGLFQLELVDSYINTLAKPATEAVYFSEKIIYYADQSKFPLLKDTANVLLKDLPVDNGAAPALKTLRQRPGALSLPESMVHELAYQLTGVSLMDDQLNNGDALKAYIRTYLDDTLPAALKVKLTECNGRTQNLTQDLLTQANIPRELFMQIVESVVGGVDPVTGSMKSSRLNNLFDASNYDAATKRYGVKLIVGDTLRFLITIAPYSVGGVVQDVDVIVDGKAQSTVSPQQARTVELIISLVA